MANNIRSSIPLKTKLILVGRAAGLCEFPGCGKRLYEDWVTKKRMNNTNFAHIIADSPDGPRGDKVLSKKLCKDVDNLMLLCPDHHSLIDSVEGIEEYSVQTLHKFKNDHEKRIRFMTSVKNSIPSTVLIYVADINNITCPISYDEANGTIFPERFPSNNIPTVINMKHPGIDERNDKFWEDEVANIEYYYSSDVERLIKQGDINHLSVFALSPMPLLVKLGVLITDIMSADIYQLHREPRTWRWQEAEQKEIFKVIRPNGHEGKKPVLIFALSSNITDRVLSYYKKDDISCWVMTIDTPNNDYLKSKDQLSDFRNKVRLIMEDIDKNSAKGDVDVYMAMSNACAVEFGRVRMPKADRHMVIYDYYEGKDNKAITI